MTNKKHLALSLLLYVGLWVLWSVWKLWLAPLLGGSLWAAAVDAVPAKLLIWVVPPALLFWRGRGAFRDLFAAPFPWLPCLIALLLSAAFLYTLRLVNGLQGTYVVFDPAILLFSLSAGVAEELCFRGAFLPAQEKAVGPRPAALLKGVIFALYHFPGLLFGENWGALLSLRALLLFVMGAVFSLLFQKWRNLALNMAVHTAWNLLSYLFCLAG